MMTRQRPPRFSGLDDQFDQRGNQAAQHQHGAAIGQHRGGQPQVDLGLAAAGDAVKQETAISEIEEALQLPKPPNRIECYDISTTQGTATVGSMVVFVHGVPRKSEYRRFKIRTVTGYADDYASMQEVLRRRFRVKSAIAG